MQKITSITDLKESILLLEMKKETEVFLLKEQFRITCESLKPLNLIKSELQELTGSPDLKENLIHASLGMATGYFSKKVAIGASHNPLKQMFGTLIQIAVAKLVSKNANGIKSGVIHLISSILRKKNSTDHEFRP